MVTVPKPGKQHSDLFWNATSGLVKLKEGQCRMCERSRRVRPLTRHHLVPLSWFLGPKGAEYKEVRNSNANIIPLCRPCHDDIHSRHPVAREMARRKLRQRLMQAEVAFAIRLAGRAWLNREYPFQPEEINEEEHTDRANYSEDDHGRENRRGRSMSAIASIHRCLDPSCVSCAPGK